ETRGFLDARIADITATAGVSQGSFYHYFDSKEQVFREVAERQEQQLTAPPSEAALRFDPADTARQRIAKANRRYLELYRDEARIMGVIEQVSRYDDEVHDGRESRQKHFAERAERFTRRLQEEGLADPAVDPGIAATALGAMIGRFAELWLVQGWADYDFDLAADQLTILWCNALGLPRE
ncbi:MAG: TetR/AcrR family transcriptional regulator, partial [Acidimicrobiales bacterium]|nr:TetR/AcrR family transcriptional regulator [Acidimicrobiales bacterium]